MGKKQKKQTTYVTAETFKIHKEKSLIVNLNQYIKLLKAKYSHIPTKQYLRLIHKFIYRLSKRKGQLPQPFVVQTKSKIKICKKCDKWAMGSQKIIQCQKCQDFYHIQCGKNTQNLSEWKCESCIEQIQSQKSKSKPKLLTKVYSCKKCNQSQNQPCIRCLKCSKYYHKKCLMGLIPICENCDSYIKTTITKQRQLTLTQSFDISSARKSKRLNQENQQDQRSPSVKKIEFKDVDEQQKEFKQIDQSTNNTIISKYKNFLAGFPKMTAQEIEKYKTQLIYAISSKNMKYNENLVPKQCSLYDDNQDSLDFALAHMSPSDFKMFNQYKKQPIGPLLLQYKQTCGYDVVADKDLPKNMIICQYVGDVYTHRAALRFIQENNDSIMQLKIGKNADQSLLIVPRQYTNIARFINGVNERDPKRKQKQNVGTFRSLARGRPVVLLYTTRAIKKGESLLYNYGAGGVSSKYDTSYYQ